MPHIVYYSIVAASIGYSIYQVHQTYQQEGLVPMLKHLGIEVAINVATAGVGRVAGQVTAPYVYKVGTRIYPSLQSALNAVLDSQPILRRGINKLVEKLTCFSDQAINSAIGQHFARLDAKIMAAEQKVMGKFKSSKIADSQSSSSLTSTSTSTTSTSTSLISTTTSQIGKESIKQTTKSGFGVTTHGVSRKMEREIKFSDIVDALKNLLKVSEVQTDIKGRISQKYIGKKITVAINPENKNIVSVYTTSSKLSKKLVSTK